MRRKVWNSQETVEREDVDSFLAKYAALCATSGMCLDQGPKNTMREWEGRAFIVVPFDAGLVRAVVVDADVARELAHPAPAASQASEPEP